MGESTRERNGTFGWAVIAVGIVVFATASGYHSVNQKLRREEFRPAMDRYFYQRYLEYKEDYPRYTGPFTGEMGTVRVIEYHPECSIIKAKYTYIGLSGGAYYYLLHKQNGSWQVIDRAPAWKLRDSDWENAGVPNPYSCESE